MRSLSYKKIIPTVAVVVSAFLTLNPFHILMSNFFQMCIYGLLLVATVVFVGLIARENARDERDEKHRAAAGRVGYLLGIVVLISGVSYQTLSHSPVDPWLIVALVVMVLGKVFARAHKEEAE